MWKISLVWSFVKYLMRARTPAQIHSPYLFKLLQFVHDKGRRYYVFDEVEHIRAMTLKDSSMVNGVDYGAGSKTPGNRTVQNVANTSVSPPLKCQTIFRLISYHQPSKILELGTSLGIMTAYLASARAEAKVVTIEGNPELSAHAKGVASALSIQNIEFHTGPFSDLLPAIVETSGPFDFVLIDGDHRGDALRTYFSMIRTALSPDAIVMIDDIRWSSDMYAAWKALSCLPEVTCSLDYFSFGVLFFRQDFLDNVRLQIIPGRFSPVM